MTELQDAQATVAQMTLEEKTSLCSGASFWHTKSVERLGVPSMMVTDGPHGLRKQDESSDHLGLGGSKPATCFPTAANLGSSWDIDLVRRLGEALGTEARSESVAVVLGPGVNIKRSPLCGRNFEYFSEDPVLTGELGAAHVAGIQSKGVGTSVKHFAANNQENDRMRSSSEVDERTLREIYLPAFERIIEKAMPWTVMCSYNRINEVYASQDPWLLDEVLRGDFGFDGLVVSDWGAVVDRVASVAAGMDLEMPGLGTASDERIVAAVKDGSLDEAVVTTAATRAVQLFERVKAGLADALTYDIIEHHQLAREVSREGIVLFKNDNAILPLDPGTQATIAVVGEFARTPRFQGYGSSLVNAHKVDNTLDLLAESAPGATVRFAPGFVIEGEGIDQGADPALLAEAVEAARGADVVLAYLGLPAAHESEGFDRSHLDLPKNQLEVLAAIRAVNPNIVVTLSNGAVAEMVSWQDQAAAILDGWLGGQAGAGAMLDVIFGVTNPSGRLAETVPVKLEDNPSFLNFPGADSKVTYGEGIFVGYRYYDIKKMDVAYPFGYGLSYTTFEYSDLAVAVADGPEPSVSVTITVTNTGARAGKEVVQVYVGDPVSSALRPIRELKAFTKVDLDPGASKTVTLELGKRDFSFWHTKVEGWVLEGGEFIVEVGASSRDIRATETITLAGEPIAPPITIWSTFGECFAHPVAGPMIAQAMASFPAMGAAASEPMAQAMMADMPLAKLKGFAAMMPSAGGLDALVDGIIAATAKPAK